MRLLLAAALVVGTTLGGARAATPCPPTDVQTGEALPMLAAILKPGGHLDVLVVGTASSDPKSGYVTEMARALQAAIQGLSVSLTFQGKRFMSAPALLDVITGELAHHHYGLVIWQTGTADAVRSVPPGDFYQALSDGAAAAAANNAAIVLVGPQFSRFLQANADIAPYLGSLHAIASTAGVLLFDRFSIMQDWSGSGAIDLEDAAPGTRAAVAARLHVCLGQQLARTLEAAVAPAP